MYYIYILSISIRTRLCVFHRRLLPRSFFFFRSALYILAVSLSFWIYSGRRRLLRFGSSLFCAQQCGLNYTDVRRVAEEEEEEDDRFFFLSGWTCARARVDLQEGLNCAGLYWE